MREGGRGRDRERAVGQEKGASLNPYFPLQSDMLVLLLRDKRGFSEPLRLNEITPSPNVWMTISFGNTYQITNENNVKCNSI